MSKTPIKADDNGESHLPTKPNAIIETAFHDNPADAAALKDGAFQTAAMKGVEKGYRLFKENQPCKHFDITSIPKVTGPQNTVLPVKINFQGYPQFPVKRKVEVVSCPSGWSCLGGEITTTQKTPSPLMAKWSCNLGGGSKPTTTFGIKYTLTDADGVKTSSKQTTVTCYPAGAKGLQGSTSKQPVFRVF